MYMTLLHSFTKYLLSTYFVLDKILDDQNKAAKIQKNKNHIFISYMSHFTVWKYKAHEAKISWAVGYKGWGLAPWNVEKTLDLESKITSSWVYLALPIPVHQKSFHFSSPQLQNVENVFFAGFHRR